MKEKKALTEIPLSPEERYEASNQLGRSLFSALQLAREQEARRLAAFNKMHSEDANTLKIPIPESLMPVHKRAAQKSYSVVEDTEGNLKHKTREEEDKTTGKHERRNAGKYLGAAAGAGITGITGGAALPAVLGGTLLGSLADADPSYKGLKYNKVKTDRLTGEREHLFDLEEGSGLGSHVKRNAGKYLGAAGGTALLGALPKSKLKLLLPFAGLSLGSSLDQMHRQSALDSLASSPEQRENMLLDATFRNNMEKNSAEGPGLFGEAMQQVNNHPVRMLIGGQAGFRDARKDFYFKQRAQMQHELMKVQKEYIDTLSRIKTGSAEIETPCVDAFCDGIAHYSMFGKTATFKDVDISDGSISRLAGDLTSFGASPLKSVARAGASSLLATGAGSAYLTYLLRKKMREEPEKYMEEQLPTRVELQPYA
jgi:hypothetical protein